MRRSRSSTRRALEAERAEIERDEARKPFEAQTRRAWELTKQFNKYPSALGPRIVTLLRTDAIVVNAGAALYNRVPRPGTYISIEYHYRPERVLAKFMASMKLPGFWPPRYNDFTVVEDLRYGLLEEDDGADAGIVRPLRDMIRNAQRTPIVSGEQVYHAVAHAQGVLVAEFSKTCAAIRELLALDSEITPEDRAARYPDGVAIFDRALFPKDWRLGAMSRFVTLPSTTAAQAAE